MRTIDQGDLTTLGANAALMASEGVRPQTSSGGKAHAAVAIAEARKRRPYRTGPHTIVTRTTPRSRSTTRNDRLIITTTTTRNALEAPSHDRSERRVAAAAFVDRSIRDLSHPPTPPPLSEVNTKGVTSLPSVSGGAAQPESRKTWEEQQVIEEPSRCVAQGSPREALIASPRTRVTVVYGAFYVEFQRRGRHDLIVSSLTRHQ